MRRSRAGGWILLCVALMSPDVQAEEPGTLVERVVAVVEGQVVTLAQLEFEARVFLIERGGSEATTAPVDNATLRSVLAISIAQRLQTLEADKLQVYRLDESALGQSLVAFEERVGGRLPLQRFLAQQDMDRSQLVELLARAQRSEKILDSKIHLRALVSEAETRREYEDHPQRYGPSFEAASPAVREALTRVRYRALAQQELASLRANANVRVLGPFAREPEDTP